MMSQLDLSMPGTLLLALGIGVLHPIYLFAVTRLPGIPERNAIQFLISSGISLFFWCGVVVLVPVLRHASLIDLALGLMALVTCVLVYLEVWGLMSRGYTLGIILTLYADGQPLTEAEISRSYRGGAGLEWIMRHRIGGLMAAGLVKPHNDGLGDGLVLTAGRGALIARLYRISIIALGMGRTG